MDVSVCILTKNESEMITDCIKSVLALEPKEIIVIDDNSLDATVDKSRHLGAKVFTYTKKNFADARNYGLSKARGKFLLYIDADERLSKDLVDEIRQTLATSSAKAFRLHRKNYYLGKPWPKEEYLERLFIKESLTKWYGEVHESPIVQGTTESLSGFLLHYTHRNLKEMIENTLAWSKIEAELRFRAHHPPVVWWRFPRVMVTVFFNYYFTQGGWKVGTVGLIESMYQAFSIFITYARLWEMQQKLPS